MSSFSGGSGIPSLSGGLSVFINTSCFEPQPVSALFLHLFNITLREMMPVETGGCGRESFQKKPTLMQSQNTHSWTIIGQTNVDSQKSLKSPWLEKLDGLHLNKDFVICQHCKIKQCFCACMSLLHDSLHRRVFF